MGAVLGRGAHNTACSTRLGGPTVPPSPLRLVHGTSLPNEARAHELPRVVVLCACACVQAERLSSLPRVVQLLGVAELASSSSSGSGSGTAQLALVMPLCPLSLAAYVQQQPGRQHAQRAAAGLGLPAGRPAPVA